MAHRVVQRRINIQSDVDFNWHRIKRAIIDANENKILNLNFDVVLPDQEGNAGKFLTTDGEHAKWEYVDVVINDKTYVHEQALAADVWHVNHNLHKKPSVTVTDSHDRVYEAQVEYNDDDNLTITLNASFKGFAYLN